MSPRIEYSPDKTEVSPFKEPLRWICNEFYHDAKRRRSDYRDFVNFTDPGWAWKYGFAGAIGLALELRQGFFPIAEKFSENFMRTWMGIQADITMDHAVGIGALSAFAFGAWYFKGSKQRQYYVCEHSVYPQGVKGTLTGALLVAITDYVARHPETLQVFSAID